MLVLMCYRQNFRSWLYRIKPAVSAARFVPDDSICAETFSANFDQHAAVEPNQMRWQAPPLPETPTDFVHSLSTICGAGR